MKKIFLYVFTTLLMCVCKSGYAQVIDLGPNSIDDINATNWQVLEAALQKMEGKYGSVSDEMAQMYDYAGKTLSRKVFPYSDAYSFALSCYEKAININKKLHGNKSVEVGDAYVNMALGCGIFVDKAKLYVDSALVILRPKCGEQSHQVARAYLALGLSYYSTIDQICYRAAQCMVVTESDYYPVSDYVDIISNLENTNQYYRKAYNIYARLGDEYKDSAETILKGIKDNEEDIKYYKEELENAKKQEK